MLFDFVHPVLDGRETLSVRNVIGHDDSVCAFVVAACDSFEALLAGGVPLKAD